MSDTLIPQAGAEHSPLGADLLNRPNTDELQVASPPRSAARPVRWDRAVLLSAHWGIILWFGSQCLYAAFQVFITLGSGPLGMRALEYPHELMVTRRLYAIEGWVATGALIIYLAITEIGPRLAAERSKRP